MILKDFACLLVDSARAKAYIQKLVANFLFPAGAVYVDLSGPPQRLPQGRESTDSPTAEVIREAFHARKYFLYSNNPQALFPAVEKRQPFEYRSFDPEKGVLETLKEARIGYRIIRAPSLNDTVVVDAVKSLSQKYLLFCGGGILRREILSLGQKFVHIHPGHLPYVRGSMAIEWSILLCNRVAASALFMAEQIDAGEVLMTRFFDLPVLENGGIPSYFSSHIRSEVLLDLVREYARTGDFNATRQNPEVGETYYKMHPALNNIVFSRVLKRA
jgi:hypothetical protein